jgi:uncharacterized flavoprotein (TIGR03862 family)
LKEAPPLKAAIIGAGPAGLMAAEVLGGSGVQVTVFERMPSPARKFLMAGRGGLNLTHSEVLETFLERYGEAGRALEAAVRTFPPSALRDWAEALGESTFVGSSGRVFPRSFKASPLLRAWLRRLDTFGVQIRTRHEWHGWTPEGALLFQTPEGPQQIRADVTLLALGGASWPRLGSDGGWQPHLAMRDIALAPLQAANNGINIAWSEVFRARFAGHPLKRVKVMVEGHASEGELMVTSSGLEGGAVYALSAPLRAALAGGMAEMEIDLKPDLSEGEISKRLSRPSRRDTLTNRLRKALNLQPAQIGLLRESAGRDLTDDPDALAALIKRTRLEYVGMQDLERAISTAGGVRLDEIDSHFMLKKLPGTFVAGEMLDWEAPTGGYLLQACFATGAAAAEGMKGWLQNA